MHQGPIGLTGVQLITYARTDEDEQDFGIRDINPRSPIIDGQFEDVQPPPASRLNGAGRLHLTQSGQDDNKPAQG